MRIASRASITLRAKLIVVPESVRPFVGMPINSPRVLSAPPKIGGACAYLGSMPCAVVTKLLISSSFAAVGLVPTTSGPERAKHCSQRSSCRGSRGGGPQFKGFGGTQTSAGLEVETCKTKRDICAKSSSLTMHILQSLFLLSHSQSSLRLAIRTE